MTSVHMLIGVGEGLATGLVMMAILRTRPALAATIPDSRWNDAAYGGLICIGLVVFVAPFACPWPDGLERVAQSLGFSQRAVAPTVFSPLAEYRLPGVGSPIAATAIAGLIGTVLAFVAAYMLARVATPSLNRIKKDGPPGR